MSAIVTPLSVLSFPAFYEKKPTTRGGDTLKYSGMFIIPDAFLQDPDEKALMDALKQGIVEAGKEKFGARFEELLKQGALRLPLRSTSEKDSIPEEYAGVFFNARSDYQPQLFTEIPDKDGMPSPLTDPAKAEPGAIGRALVTFYGYDNMSKGIGVGLEGWQFVREGEVDLVNKVNAAEVFSANPNARANLGDVAAAAGAGGENLQGMI